MINITIEEQEKLKRKLAVEVPLSEVQSAYEQVFSQLRNNIRINGFRPGKFPRALAEKRFNAAMAGEAMQTLVPKYYQKALEQLELRPSTEPKFDELEIDKKKPFRFKVEFEVVPDFKLLPPSTFKLKEKPVKVSKEDVDARLDDLRRARASLEDKGQEKAQSGDVVTFDYKGTLDGEVFQGGTAENQQMEIGSNNYLPDFASQFDDIKAGEEKTFPLTFPKDYGEPTLAGKQVEFSIKVKKVERKVLPEMNKEFFSQVGKFETEQEVREHLSEQLRGEKEAGQKQELHDELTEQIRKKYDFDVPETLAQQMLERFQHNLSHQDPDAVMDEKKFNKRSEEELENIKANLRLTYVFDKVSEENGIKADQEVVRQRFFMQSYMMRQNPTDLIKTEAGNRLIYQIEQAAIGEKVLDHLVAQVLGKSGSSDKGSPEAGETADKPAKKKPAGKKPTEKK